MKTNTLISVPFLILFLLSVFTAGAQKLKNVQQTSIKAPANIKIDGRPTEWGANFQAYNHATEVFYTIANDANNLYLVVQARDNIIINKILFGGVTFAINNSGKKNDDQASITYPFYDKTTRPGINLKNEPQRSKDTVAYYMHVDSFMRAANDTLNQRTKRIMVTGMPGVTDTVISIYNEYGLKAAAQFNGHLYYTLEMAIPLKYLGLKNESTSFGYHITLNGVVTKNSKVVLSTNGAMYMIKSNTDSYIVPASPQYMGYMFPTDFFGQYAIQNLG